MMMDKGKAIEMGFGLLDTAETSRATGIPVDTLESWRCRSRRQGPPYLKLSNGMVRYKFSDIQNWLDERRVVPSATSAAISTEARPIT